MPNIIEDDGYLLSTLEKIRQKLLDHTRRNRLLNYKETARDIAVIDEMADFVFEDLVLNDVRFNFSHYNRSDCEGEEANLVGELGPDRTLPETQTARGDVDGRYRDNILQTPFSSGELERRLRKLYSEHKTLIEETGANSLFLAMGFLEWSDSEDAAKPMLSPCSCKQNSANPLWSRREYTTSNAAIFSATKRTDNPSSSAVAIRFVIV